MAQLKPVIVNGIVDESRYSPWRKQTNTVPVKRKSPSKISNSNVGGDTYLKKKAAVLNHINNSPQPGTKKGSTSDGKTFISTQSKENQQPKVIRAQDYAKANSYRVPTHPTGKKQQPVTRNNVKSYQANKPSQNTSKTIPTREKPSMDISHKEQDSGNVIQIVQPQPVDIKVIQDDESDMSEDNLSIYIDNNEDIGAYTSLLSDSEGAESPVSPKLKKRVLEKSNHKVNHVKEIIRDYTNLHGNSAGAKHHVNAVDTKPHGNVPADKGVTINLYMTPDLNQKQQTFTVPLNGNIGNSNQLTVRNTPQTGYMDNGYMVIHNQESVSPFTPRTNQNTGNTFPYNNTDSSFVSPRVEVVGEIPSQQSSYSNMSTYMRYIPKEGGANYQGEGQHMGRAKQVHDHSQDVSSKHYLINKGHVNDNSAQNRSSSSTPKLPYIHHSQYSSPSDRVHSATSANTISSSGRVQYLLRNKSRTKHIGTSTADNSRSDLSKEKSYVVSLPLLVDRSKTHTKLIRETEVQTDFDYVEEDSSDIIEISNEIATQTGNVEKNTATESNQKATKVEKDKAHQRNKSNESTTQTDTNKRDSEEINEISTQTEEHKVNQINEIATQTEINDRQNTNEVNSNSKVLKDQHNDTSDLERSKTISTSTSELDKLERVKNNSVETSTFDLDLGHNEKVDTYMKNRSISTDTSDLTAGNIHRNKKKCPSVYSTDSGLGGTNMLSLKDKKKLSSSKDKKKKGVNREIKSMINEEDEEWEDVYQTGLHSGNNYHITEDNDGSGLSSDEDIVNESDEKEIYVLYLQTEKGALIGPLKLEIDDIQIGLPSGDKELNKNTGSQGYIPSSASIDGSTIGLRNRATGSNSVNEHSSRSHSMLTLHLDSDQQDPDDENLYITKHGKLTFVDLAGSEKTKSDQVADPGHMVESNNINRSLLVLGNCISALGDSKRRQGHIPYRDSKLTKLLADSLGGNGVTLMIACVSPSSFNGAESMNTLRYANRAKKIKTKPVITMDPREKLILSLKREIKILRQENHYLRQQMEFPVKPRGQLQRENDEKFLRMLKQYKLDNKVPDHHGLYEMLQEYMIENETLRNENSTLYESRDKGRREQQMLARENERLVRRIETVGREQMMQGTPMSMYSMSSRKSSASDGRQYYDYNSANDTGPPLRQNPVGTTPRGVYGQPKRPPHRLSEPLNKNNPAYIDQQTPRNSIPSHHISQQPPPAQNIHPHYDYQMSQPGPSSPRKVSRANHPPPQQPQMHHPPQPESRKNSKVSASGGSPVASRRQSGQSGQYHPTDVQRQPSNSTVGGESVQEMNERLRLELLELEGQIRNQSQNNTPQQGSIGRRYEVR